MAKLPVLTATALAVALAAPAGAQTWRDRLNQGAEAARQGAGRIAGQVEKSVEGTVDLMTDEATPEETRAELDARAFATLDRLFLESPDAGRLFEESAGWAVFDTRQVGLMGLAGGVGRGVAVWRDTGERIYMNMGTGGVGFSFGLGGYETQIVILFQNDAAFDVFVTQGYDATAEGGMLFGQEDTRGTVRFSDGRSIFYLTQGGWKVSGTLGGTKYWRDVDLN